MFDGFSYIAEVPTLTVDTKDTLNEKANDLLQFGFNMVSFSDRARADSNATTIQDLLKLEVFKRINSDALLAILATRTKYPEEIDQIAENLKKQNVKNLFIVTGDPHKSSRTSFLTSLDVIPKLAKDFKVGAAIHADVASLNRDIKKIDAGAKFLIVQASYDSEKWQEWLAATQSAGINKKVRIFQCIIPLVNKTILENVHSIPDVHLPETLFSELSSYSDDKLKEYGKNSAISSINELAQNNFFSGVYIYCRDLDILKQIRDSIPN